jgi:hypothetical protein
VLLARLPLIYKPKSIDPFDLHVLGVLLAFILSQDQTLHKNALLRWKDLKPNYTSLLYYVYFLIVLERYNPSKTGGSLCQNLRSNIFVY